MKKVLINIKGLDFSKADELKQSIKSLEGVEQVNVQAAKQTVYVEHTTTLEMIEQKIKEFGPKIVYDHAKFLVSGLHSADSAKPLEKTLSIEGVKSVHVDYPRSCVILLYNSSLVPKPVELITASGYKVVEVGCETWRQLRKKQIIVQSVLFLFCVVFSVPVALWSYTNIPFPETMIRALVLFFLATPVVCIGGYQFYVGAYRALRHKLVTRDVLISLAVIAGYLYSVIQTFFTEGVLLYAAIVLIVTIITLGRLIELALKPKILPPVRAVGVVSSTNIRKLLDKIPYTALEFDAGLSRYYPYLGLATLIIGIVAFFVWLGSGMLSALLFAMAVLIAANPSLLELAKPAMILTGLGAAMNYGVIFRSAYVLERTAKVNTVVFDKIGTLSKGHKFTGVEVLEGDEKEVLRWAATAVAGVDYVLRDQILVAAKNARAIHHRADEQKVLPASGIIAKYVNKEIQLGRVEHERAKALEKEGKTVLGVIVDKKLLGFLMFEDERKNFAKLAVRALKNMGIKTVMSTPETKRVGSVSAAELGIDQVVERHELKEKLARFKEQGRIVAFVGESKHKDADVIVNDSIEADVILAEDSIKDVVAVFQTARAIMGRVKWNLYASLLYHLVVVLLAVGVFSMNGVKLHPVYAAVIAVLAGVAVLVHAILFRKFVPAVKKYWAA